MPHPPFCIHHCGLCESVSVCLVVMVAAGWGQAVGLGVGLVGEDEEDGERELVCSFTLPVTQQFQSGIFVNNPLLSLLLPLPLIPFALFCSPVTASSLLAPNNLSHYLIAFVYKNNISSL